MCDLKKTILCVLLTAGWAASGLADVPESDLIKQIDRHVKQLGADDYLVREEAQRKLAKFGFEAFDAIMAATNHEDLEIATRARYLLSVLQINWTVDSDPDPVKSCLSSYGSLDANHRIAKMSQIAGLPDGAGLPALCRLVRFERVPVLSKMAAIRVLGIQPGRLLSRELLKETLQNELSNSRRPGAKWLLTSLEFDSDPNSMLTKWNKYVSAELTEWKRAQDSVQRTIVVELVRYQLSKLVKMKRTHEATVAIRRLSKLGPGSLPLVSQLAGWLVTEQAWEVLLEVPAQCGPKFHSDPTLQYYLAQAYAGTGRKMLAEQIAQRAIKLLPGKTPHELQTHLGLGMYLRDQRLYEWSDREFRYVIASTPRNHVLNGASRLMLCASMQKRGMFKEAEKEYREAIKDKLRNIQCRLRAYQSLSDMLHDMGKDLAAADVLREMLESVDGRNFAGFSQDAARARMDFLYAMHFEKNGDRAKQRQHLKRAIDSNDRDVEVLIAYYRLPDLTEKERKKIVKLVHALAGEIKKQVLRSPNSMAAYNEYAWLVSNTEGDYGEALRFSRESIQLSPENGGYYDTLGRCYFALGDLENAVAAQAKAVKFEPHSRLIAKQLKFFRDAIDKQNKKRSIKKNRVIQKATNKT